jgi:uncharacterized iron-regulated membrane protein
LVGLSGFAGLLFVATGTLLWWPDVKNWALGFKLRLRRTTRLRDYDLYKVFGFFSLPVLFLASATGIFFVFPAIKEATVHALGAPHAPAASALPSPPAADPAPLTTYAALARAAEAAVAPGAAVSWYPGLEHLAPGEIATVYLSYPGNPDLYAGGILVELRPSTGEIVHVHDSRFAGPGEWIETNTFGLHIGTWAGLPGRLAYLLLGLSPALLAWTGWRLWRRRSARARLSAPSLAQPPG